MLRSLLSPLLLAVVAVSASAQSFLNPVRVVIDPQAVSVAVADFNGDGIPDLLVGSSADTSELLRIYLGDGRGGYRPAGQVTLSTNADNHCQALDVNADGRIDVVCNGRDSNGEDNLLTFLGNGDGTLQPAIVSPLPGSQENGNLVFVAAGDLNRDGHVDLVYHAYRGFGQEILAAIGDGAGHFRPVLSQGGGSTIGLIADVNRDGIPDLLGSSGAAVLIGLGGGAFAQIANSAALGSCLYADFAHTGSLVAACVSAPDTLVFLAETPGGAFDTVSPLATVVFKGLGPIPRLLQAIDLNGDGLLDLVISTTSGLQIALAQPNLQFADPVAYAAGDVEHYSEIPLAVFADLNGDGHPDFVSATAGGIFVSYGTASGSLQAPIQTKIGERLFASVLADFHGNGMPDAITVGDTGLNLLPGQGDGTFGPPVPLSLPAMLNFDFGTYSYPQPLVGDFNGDGKPDLLISTDVMDVGSLTYLGVGNGTFLPPVSRSTSPSIISPYSGALVADIDNDGKDDVVNLALLDASVDAFLSQGDGTFRLVRSTFPYVDGNLAGLALADFAHRGKQDLLVALPTHATIMRNQGGGSFLADPVDLQVPDLLPQFQRVEDLPPSAAVGDFDGDGNLDIVLLSKYGRTDALGTRRSVAWLYYGNTDGTFQPPINIFDAPGDLSAVATVLDGSSRSSLILYSNGSGPSDTLLAVLSANSQRTFGPPNYLTGGTSPGSVHVADLNGDGTPDLFLSNDFAYPCDYSCANTLTVLLSHPTAVTGNLAASPEPSAAGQSYSVTATLVPGSGKVRTLGGHIDLSVDGLAVTTLPVDRNQAQATISTGLTAGPHQLTATWSGDALNPPLALTVTHHIMAAAAQLTLTSSANPAVAGDTVSFTAALSAAAATGTLSFSDGGASLGTFPLTPGAAFVLTPPLLTTGMHPIQVAYSGDATFPASSASLTEVIAAAPSQVQLAISPNPAPVGTPVTLRAVVQSPTKRTALQPTGVVSFFAGGTLLGSQSITQASGQPTASVITSSLLPGTRRITCQYGGDPFFAPSDCNPVSLTIAPASSTLTASASPNPIAALLPFNVQAHLAAVTGSMAGLPLTLSYRSPAGLAVVLSASTDASGAAQWTIPGLDAGIYNLTVSFAGSQNLLAATTAFAETVFRVDSATQLTATPNPSIQNRSVTVVARVAPVGGGSHTPQGSVVFFDGQTNLGPASLDATGSASFATNTFLPGPHTLTGQYGGDLDVAPSVSSAVVLTVTTQDFTVATNPDLTLKTQHHQEMTVALTSMGGFSDTIALACAGLPQYATCRFSSANANLAPNATESVQLHLDTDQVIDFASNLRPASGPPAWAAALAMLVPLALSRRRRGRRLWMRGLFAFGLAYACFMATGCSGKYPYSTPPGSYTFSVTAHAVSGNLSHAAVVKLVVEP